MQEIIRNYGHFMLEATVVILLFLFLLVNVTDEQGNRGVFEIAGARIETDTPDYTSYRDFSSYETESGRKGPEISYHGGNGLRVGTVKISDYVKASDEAGAEVPIQVIRVTDREGKLIPVQEDTSVQLVKAGIYTVQVSAVDGYNKKTESRILIPVNN